VIASEAKQSNPRFNARKVGLLRRFVPRNDEVRANARILTAQNSPELCVAVSLGNRRAQGMPGAVAPAASCAGNAQWNAHEFSAGTTEHTPASPAQWFSAYTRSPRSTGLVSLRRPADHGVSGPKGRHRHSARLDASVGAPGPRDFAVRIARRSS